MSAAWNPADNENLVSRDIELLIADALRLREGAASQPEA